MQSDILAGKRVIVSGSTQGIGQGIAEAMLRTGARVITNSHEPVDPKVLQTYRELGECHFVQSDMSTIEGVRALIRQGAELLGGLDVLVNNAGTFADVDFLELDESRYARTFDLNVRGYLFASQEFARIVGERDFDAAIVCTGSTNGLQAELDSVLYDASKGAVLMMVRSMALTLARRGIRVNGVGPGLIRTPLSSGGLESNPEGVRLLEQQIPAGRIGAIEDPAGAAVFLASDAARYITGQMLYVDGGILANQIMREMRG